MVAWLTTITSVLPLLTDLVSKALPVLTSKRSDKAADIVSQQIGELQSAVTENARAIKVLAEQLQRTVVAVEEGAEDLQQRSKRSDKAADIVSQQIGALQSAVTENAQAIKILAEQLQRAFVAFEERAEDLQNRDAQFKESLRTTNSLIATLEQRMSQLDKRGNRQWKFCLITIGIALTAMCLSLLLIAR